MARPSWAPAVVWALLVLHVAAQGSRVRIGITSKSRRSLRRTGPVNGISGPEVLFGPSITLQSESPLPQGSWHSSLHTERPHVTHAGQYLALCLAVKDQHTDIREWLEHHLLLGVGKVYIFDNSTIPMLTVFQDLVQSGMVEYFQMDGSEPDRKAQLWIYDECLRRFGDRHTWMGFTDADEFLVLRDHRIGELPSLLQEYEAFGGLAINWQMFGSSGWKDKPLGSTLSSFTACFPRDHAENLHVKTIANTRHTLHSGEDPHHFIYEEPYYAVTTDRQRVDGAKSANVTIDKIALHHYATKSLSEFQAKMARGSAMRNVKTSHFFDFVQQQATANCTGAPYESR